MIDSRKKTGRRGEALAAAYFVEKGYTILQRNWRCPAGELDIVMARDDTLIFVEVRARRGNHFGSAEESITPAKRARLIALAHTYIQQEQPPHTAWRIDVAAVRLDSRSQITHIENAVGW
ncbi:MAG TPA: YraN family protein [Anaerolineae bacterium]|nr:YraN family protein [Anaerolineae bacterium]